MVYKRAVLLLILLISILAFSINASVVNTTIPSYLLQVGDNMNDATFDFQTQTEISTGLSDDNDATNYQSFFASSPVPFSNLIDGYSFNEYIFASTLHSYKGNHTGAITGSLDTVTFSDTYYGGYFDGTNDYITIPQNTDFDIPDLGNLTMCAVFNTTLDSPSTVGLITKGSLLDGFFMRYTLNEDIDCHFDGTTNSMITTTPTTVNDGEEHIVCCRKWDDSTDMWFDGELVDTDTKNVGAIANANNLYIASEDLGVSRWEGTIKQVGFFNSKVSDSILLWMNESKSIGNMSAGQSIEAFFNHSFEISPIHEHFLILDSDVSSTSAIRVETYSNATEPNSTNYYTTTITTGMNYLPIDDLVYGGYNFPFRIWGLEGRSDFIINDIYLTETVNDTINPSITNCQVNTTSINCGETVRLQCNVTDDQAIYKTWFTYNNSFLGTETTVEVNKDGEVYYIDLTFYQQVASPVELLWSIANTTDLIGNTNITYPNLNVTYTCCLEDWQPQWTNSSCYMNDTTENYVEYTDASSCGTTFYLPDDNGTTDYGTCNYCSADIQEEEGLCRYENGTYIRNVTYIDNLYSFCCGLTGLESDCGIDYYPYNQTTTEFCTLFNNTMDCDSNTYTEYGFIGDKVRWICYPPVTTNTTTNCMSYVKDVHSGVIQTNPNYFTRTESLISWDNEYEDRTSFEAVGNMVSIYFTKDNLMFDGREFVFGVRCTNDGTYYDYEMLITPEYENMNAPITRIFWVKENIIGLVLGGIVMAFLILVLAGYIRELRRK